MENRRFAYEYSNPKDIIKGFTFIIIKYTIIELKNGFRMLKLRGCSLNKYQTWIKRIPPKKSIEAKVATAAPIPAYRGIKIMFKTKLIIKTNIEFIKLIFEYPVIDNVWPLEPINDWIKTEIVRDENDEFTIEDIMGVIEGWKTYVIWVTENKWNFGCRHVS